MNDVMRDRIWRKLQVLPDAQLYQVLDYIEFLETKYARDLARKPDSLQRFAEKLEDSLRMRAVAPKVISGTVGAIGTARRVVRSVTDVGRDIIDGVSEVARTPEPGDPRASVPQPRAPQQIPPPRPRGATTSTDPESA
jgi:hypothetical protein